MKVTTDAGISYRLQEMEDRILGIEDKIEKIDSLVKENVKHYTQNIQEI